VIDSVNVLFGLVGRLDELGGCQPQYLRVPDDFTSRLIETEIKDEKLAAGKEPATT
jgi:threonine dehydrogenase-like Zn-dependent dehydrogenase